MKSPLNYMGGKSRLAQRIVEMIPPHSCYCEPFCGAAWVFFTKEPSKVEVLNDVDGDLVNFWRIIQNHLEEFLRYYKYAVISRKLFELENRKIPDTLTDIQRAVRYYYLQRLCFGGRTVGRTFGVCVAEPPRLNLATVQETLLEVHWRLQRVTIENLSAFDVITRYDRPDTFFYVDPPYLGRAGYTVPFPKEDYSKLSAMLGDVSGRFILSINDTRQIRDIFRPFSIVPVKTSYSVANARKVTGARNKDRRELLIHNLKS